jgi:hypothetical protein
VTSIRRTASLTLLLLVAACGSGPTAPGLTGEWGGPEANLTLSASGGTVEYACGEGTIDPSWTFGPGGQWHATGQHFTGGGPVPPSGRTPHPATYAGTLHGDKLTFTATLTDLDQILGPFTVTRGPFSNLNVCL